MLSCSTPRWTASALKLALLALAVPAGAQLVPSQAAVAATPPATAAANAASQGFADLIERVLARDPQVRVQQAQLDAAGARWRQARSRRWPTLGLAVTKGGSDEIESNRPVNRDTQRTDATLRWNLYNGGADEIELAAAEVDWRAAELDLRRAREEVAERLADAALDLARLEGLIVASARRLNAMENLSALARRQTEAGRLSEADWQQAEASLFDARVAHEQLQADRSAARLKLSALASEPLQPTVDYSPLPWLARAGEPAETPHSGLRALQLKAEAARARTRSALSLLAPRVDLDVTRRLSDRTSPAPSTELRNSWQVGIRWEYPLGGETNARRQEVIYRAEAAEAEADRQRQLWLAELRSIPPRIRHSEEALAMLTGQIERQSRLVQAGELQFEAGRRSLQQLLQLRDSHHNSEVRWAEQWQRLQLAKLKRLSLNGQWLTALGWAPPPPADDDGPATPTPSPATTVAKPAVQASPLPVPPSAPAEAPAAPPAAPGGVPKPNSTPPGRAS